MSLPRPSVHVLLLVQFSRLRRVSIVARNCPNSPTSSTLRSRPGSSASMALRQYSVAQGFASLPEVRLVTIPSRHIVYLDVRDVPDKVR
jgi:hypothetical protein